VKGSSLRISLGSDGLRSSSCRSVATKGKLRSNEVSCDQSTTVPVDCRPKFIPVPETNIQVVNSNESLAAGLNALLLPGTGSGLAGHLQVVGLDCEWRPFPRGATQENPVAVLQVVTRTDAFLIDMLHWARPIATVLAANDETNAEDGQRIGSPEFLNLTSLDIHLTDKEKAIDKFLSTLFNSENLTLVGFQFGYDAHRLQSSYPHLPVFQQGGAAAVGKRVPVVEILSLSRRSNQRLARVGRVSLEVLVQRVLTRSIDKEQQCSDWGQRPLTPAQIRYAADDAYVVVAMFDAAIARCGPTFDLSRIMSRFATGLYTQRGARSGTTRKVLQSHYSKHVKVKGAKGLSIDKELSIDTLVEQYLGLPLRRGNLRTAAAQLLDCNDYQLIQDRAGQIIWKNAVMVFVTVGDEARFKFDDDSELVETGESAELRRVALDHASKHDKDSGTKNDHRELQQLLFCKKGGKTFFFGRISTQHIQRKRMQWKLNDFALLRSNRAFQMVLET